MNTTACHVSPCLTDYGITSSRYSDFLGLEDINKLSRISARAK